MNKPIDLQFVYKKQIGFTKDQYNSLKILQNYGININKFIRQAVKEKIQKDWPKIKESKNKEKCPF